MSFNAWRRQALGVSASLIGMLVVAACGGSTDETPSAQPQARFQTTVVIGASLTDTGNRCISLPSSCPPSPPYAAGKYSNGVLWIERVAANYGSAVRPSLQGGTNYAYAGAVTGVVPLVTAAASAPPNMVAQTSAYLTAVSGRARPEGLYVIDASTFGNNVNAALSTLTTQAAITNFVRAAAGDVALIMAELYAAGARNFLVVNSPNLGATPLLAAAGATTAGSATALAAGFNAALTDNVITPFRAVSPGARVVVLDAFTFGNTVAAAPATYGFTDVRQACVLVPTCVGSATVPGTYFYWDTFHPTAATGALVAQQAISLLQ
jgi:outer membrane lipase/esterase